MMKKPWMIIFIVCLLIVPVLAHAQFDKFLENVFGKDDRGISLDSLTVTQMEMIPDSPRDDQSVAFRAIIANSSRHAVRVVLAVVEKDRVVTQVSDASLGPGNNQIDFPETSIQFSRGEQRCFTIQTNIDHRWVPITMATEFCPERSRRDRGVELSVEGLRMTPDPVSPGQEVSFVVRLRNDGRQEIRGKIRIQDSDQVVVQTDTVRIPRGVTNFNLPSSRYTFERMDTCFTVSVDVDRTHHQIDASEEYCANPTAWTLQSRRRGQRGNRDSPRGDRER
jgi:hypothetical protein